MNELQKCAGEIIVHVNSGGGDVFEALAIYNALKSYNGNVTTQIDGIAASAASIISCAGDVVKMANNAMLMIHLPSVVLSDYYSAADLEKISASLNKVKETLITTYTSRTRKPSSEIEGMLTAETWLTAAQAKELGFVDEVTGDSEIVYDASQKILIVNKLKIDCQHLNETKLKAFAQEETTMDDKIFESYKNSVLQAERLRVRNLVALKSENEAVNAIIDAAIDGGKEVEEVQPFIAALGKLQPANKTLDVVNAQIRDNLKSGAEGVEGSIPAEEIRKSQAAAMAAYANKLIGGGAK